ncbi:MAG TPA: hypothetical protein VJS39_06055, partial [Gemmatimonadaceae bacterium]|nr:hypothetical protein [Gemmatimonadaceae bacterium]
LAFVPAALAVEMAEQLVGAVDKVDNHSHKVTIAETFRPATALVLETLDWWSSASDLRVLH